MEAMPIKLEVPQSKPVSQTEGTQSGKVESGKEGEFQSMINRLKKQAGQDETPEEAVVLSSVQTMDLQLLQELTAMQMLCVDARQIVVVQPEEDPQQQMSVAAPVAANEAPAAAVETPVEIPQAKTAEIKEAPVAQSPVDQKAAEETPEVKITPVERQNTEKTVEMDVKRPVAEELPQEKASAKTESVEVSAEGVQEKVFARVETTPIKVSEAAKEPVPTRDVGDQVGEALTKALAKGETKVELQLTPEHLGKIKIELTQKQGGGLEIALHAENSQTRMMLERDLPNLQNLFSRNTQQEVLVEVPRHQEAQQNESYDGHQQQRQQQEQRQQQKRSEDFLNQMRLGFIPVDESAV